MQHRWSKRTPARLRIGIEYPGGQTVYGQTRDISFGGMFIETDMADPPTNAMIQLVLPLEDGSSGSFIRIPAIVVRRSIEGLGVSYHSHSEDVFQRLRIWLLEMYNFDLARSRIQTA